MTDWQKITEALQAKLDAKHVCPPKQFGPKGDYLEGWHVMAEANRIFGFNGWQYEVTECTCVWQGARDIGRDKKPGFGVSYTAKVRVVAGGVVREDFGAGHGYDVDCGLAHESAIKEAVTDAYKRAMRSFGNPFGLALYDKSRENVETAPSADKSAPDWQALSDKMLRAVRNVGAKAWGHPDFKRDLANLKAASPELAAHVEAEIQTKQQAEAA